MNKIVKIILIFLMLSGCGYQPILLNKKYNFQFVNIIAQGDSNINKIIKDNLTNRKKNNASQIFDINFISKREKETISSNAKGDPKVYKMKVFVNYQVKERNEVILSKSISKQTTYNNIDDKFELLKYEENILKDLSNSLSSEILISIATTDK